MLDACIELLQLLQGHIFDPARAIGGSVKSGIMDHHLGSSWFGWIISDVSTLDITGDVKKRPCKMLTET